MSLALAVVTFAVLWLAVAAILYHTAFFDWRLLNWLIELLGGLAVLALTWLLFPAAVTLIMSFYLERVAAAVEAVDYPERGPPRPPQTQCGGQGIPHVDLRAALHLLAP